jgi:hypothetical protein
LLLAVVAVGALFGMFTTDVAAARRIEDARLEHERAIEARGDAARPAADADAGVARSP